MKNVLITGVSQGIGRAIAEKLASNGYFIYGTYNTHKKEAQGLKEKLKNCKIFQVDLADRKQTLDLIKDLKGARFDGVVNNAGIFEDNPIENFDVAQWDKTIEVNLTAPLLLVQGLLKELNDNAAIVNISSVDAYFGAYLSIPYAASKAALISVTRSLATSLGQRRIRVNAIAPGWIDTDMGSEAAGVPKEATDKTPLGRNGSPQEVAELVAFLLSDKASFIDGEVINLDGGYSIVDEVLKREAEKASS